MSQESAADCAEKEDIGGVGSPSTSISSMISEQSEVTRNSPFLTGQSSPLFTSSLFQKPDFSTAVVPDSETSSRSSWDGISLKGTTAERIEKYKVRCKRSPSNSGSDNDDEVSNDATSVARKISYTIAEDKFVGRGIDAPRGRIANIRRESNCSVDSEFAHERMVKASQQVSSGFDDFTIEPDRRSPSSLEIRKRAPSFTCIGEPISVVTNAFMPHSCSPSPTRLPEALKQCYSPSTQQIIRANISYTPSPRGSPSQSPTRRPKPKLLSYRSVSPISLGSRQCMKRKLPSIDGEIDGKRAFIQRNNTSPLVNEKNFPYPTTCVSNFEHNVEFASPSVPHSPAHALETSRNMTPVSSTTTDNDDNSPISKKDELNGEVNLKSTDVEMYDYGRTDNNGTEIKTDSIMVQQALAASLPDDDF